MDIEREPHVKADQIGRWQFSVNGMHCVGCVRKIQKAAAEMNLGSAEVDLGRKTVTVKARTSEDPNIFRDRINQLGFEAKFVKADPAEETSNKTARTYLARIGVSGACAGNIMLISIAGYSGADVSDLSKFFAFVSGALFLPIFTFCAFPFYQNCWVSLKRKKISVDVPIALAVLFGGAISFYHALIGSNQVYFDSISMFVFFLLSSRFLVFKVQKKYLRPMELSDLSDQKFHTVERDQQALRCSANEIRPEDIVRVGGGEFIPADGELLSPFALIDASVFSGESMPVSFKHYDHLYAGMKNAGNEIRLRVIHGVRQSRIQEIIERVNQVTLRDSRLLNLTDKGAGLLTVSIVLLAAFFGLASLIFDISQPLDRVLALLVVACPCALAIASPLSLSLSIRNALRKGILIKDANVFDSLNRVETFVFDKTGTLSSNLEVNLTSLNTASDEDLDVLFAMETNFDHPVAKCVRRHFGSETDIKVDAELLVSGGVQCQHKGRNFVLIPIADAKEKIFEFSKDGIVILRFSMTEGVDESTKKYISDLLSEGRKIYLVTGDTKTQAENMSKNVGTPFENVFYEVSPEEKLEILSKLKGDSDQPIVYVGDGVNDVLALKEADIGVSTMSSAEATFNLSQVHLIENGVGVLRWLTSACQRSTKTIKWLVAISLVYNIAFGTLALTGLIDPLVAVIIMPLSTLSLTLFVLLRSKESIQKARA